MTDNKIQKKIDESQLQSWAYPPAASKYKTAHEQIRLALSKSTALSKQSYEVYLQGSYANSTNIHAESDVDVVVQLNSTFYSNKDTFTAFERSLFDLTFSSSDYSWTDFKVDVLAALVDYFGAKNVEIGTKCIKLKGNETRVNADILPGVLYKKYNGFNIGSENTYIEGLKFWTKDNTEIINYPKIHIKHGESKNAHHRTKKNYKDTVRIVKNMAITMLDEYGIDRKIAPSYFLECSVYNAPDGHFHFDHEGNVEAFFHFIMRQVDATRMVTVSHQHELFGVQPWQWNQQHAAEFYTLLEEYYHGNK